MKPDWDKLIEDFKDSSSSLVADVDCTTEGKSLCETHGVKGYPTIKYGDPSDLKDYSGGRTYEDLKKFADENLGPSCGPDTLDICSDEQKALIKKFQAMSLGKLDAKVRKADKEIAKIEGEHATLLEEMQKTMEAAEKKKEADIKAIKDAGLTLMKVVLAKGKDAKKEL